MKSEKLKRGLLVALVWVLIVAFWEGSYRIIEWKAYVFPAPSHILDSLLNLFGMKTWFGDPVWLVDAAGHSQAFQRDPQWPLHGQDLQVTGSIWNSQLLEAVGISLFRLLIGFSISLVLGLFIGLAMFRFKFIDALLGPVFLGLQTLPSVCWVPLAVLALGINETGILFVTVMGSFFSIAITLRDGLRLTPTIYRSAGLVFGAHGIKFYTQVMLPAGLPALASSLRSGFSFAWRSLMGGELIFVLKQEGVGHLLAVGREFGDVGQVVGVMFIMVLIGMAADRFIFAPLEKKVQSRFGLGG